MAPKRKISLSHSDSDISPPPLPSSRSAVRQSNYIPTKVSKWDDSSDSDASTDLLSPPVQNKKEQSRPTYNDFLIDLPSPSASFWEIRRWISNWLPLSPLTSNPAPFIFNTPYLTTPPFATQRIQNTDSKEIAEFRKALENINWNGEEVRKLTQAAMEYQLVLWGLEGLAARGLAGDIERAKMVEWEMGRDVSCLSSLKVQEEDVKLEVPQEGVAKDEKCTEDVKFLKGEDGDGSAERGTTWEDVMMLCIMLLFILGVLHLIVGKHFGD